MTEQRERELICRAIDQRFSGKQGDPWLAKQIIEIEKGDIKMKKKLSLAMVLAIIALTIAVTALAVITIKEVGRQSAENEKQQGYFVNWELEKKIKLISNLADLQYIERSDEVSGLIKGSLTEQEAHEAANDIIASFTGQDVDGIGFMSIMQVPMGSVENWTYEEKAWYSTLMREVGIESDGMTQFVQPSGRISEQEAIAIARREIAKGYMVLEDELDRYRVSVDFEIPEAAESGNKQAYWHVRFEAPEDISEDERLFILFPVYIHPDNGSLLWSVQDMLSIPDSGE